MSYTPASSPPFGYHAASPSSHALSPPAKRSSSGTAKQAAMKRPSKPNAGPSSVKGKAGQGLSSNYRKPGTSKSGSRAPSLMSARSRPGSVAESENVGPYGRSKLKSATPGMGRASRPGSIRPTSEFGKDNYGDEDDEDDEAGNEEELASDYGDNEEGEEGGTAPGEEKKLLSAEEERILEEMGQREVDLQLYAIPITCRLGRYLRLTTVVLNCDPLLLGCESSWTEINNAGTTSSSPQTLHFNPFRRSVIFRETISFEFYTSHQH